MKVRLIKWDDNPFSEFEKRGYKLGDIFETEPHAIAKHCLRIMHKDGDKAICMVESVMGRECFEAIKED